MTTMTAACLQFTHLSASRATVANSLRSDPSPFSINRASVNKKRFAAVFRILYYDGECGTTVDNRKTARVFQRILCICSSYVICYKKGSSCLLVYSVLVKKMYNLVKIQGMIVCDICKRKQISIVDFAVPYWVLEGHRRS